MIEWAESDFRRIWRDKLSDISYWSVHALGMKYYQDQLVELERIVLESKALGPVIVMGEFDNHLCPPAGPEPAILDWYSQWDEGWAYVCEQASGVWGHALPERCLKLGTLRSLLRLYLGQNATTISTPVVSAATN